MRLSQFLTHRRLAVILLGTAGSWFLLDYAYRKLLFSSVGNFLMMGVWPLLGAAFMFWILGESIPSNGAVIDWVGLGGLALGFIPMIVYWIKGSAYFRQRPTLGSTVPDDLEPIPDPAR